MYVVDAYQKVISFGGNYVPFIHNLCLMSVCVRVSFISVLNMKV